MRFLHTSDWHLGRSISGHDLTEAQAIAVNTMIDVAIERQVHAFVIAGDIFDRAFPSVEDVRALNLAFTRIHSAGIPLIVTAGNHDEGARLAAFKNLLADAVCIVGEYNQVGKCVELRDQYGPVVFYPLPYLDPDGARRALAPSPDALLGRSHEAVMSEAMRRVREDLNTRKQADASTRAVVIAHAFVVTGRESEQELKDEQSESERDLTVGGLPTVPSAVFAGVDYVALGHLHGARTVGAGVAPHIRYSGSILRYSVSEVMHEKSCSIVEFDASGICSIETIALPQPTGMARLRGTLTELCADVYTRHADDFVELTLTDVRLPDNYYAQLTERFARILQVKRSADLGPMGEGQHAQFLTAAVTPLETMKNYYQSSTSEEPSERIVAILQDVLERAQKDLEV